MATVLLVVTGVVVIVVGVLRIRGPLGRIRQLDETQANLDRYESWRGKHTGVDTEGPTGADEMRSQMRQRVLLWAAVIGVGVAVIVVGLLLG